MAYVLSQLPVHCGTVQPLKEPDAIPTLKYLFDRDLGPTYTKPEVSEEVSDIKPEVKSEEQELIVDVISYEDPESPSNDNLQLKIDEDVFIDVVTCEDTTNISTNDAPKKVVTPPFSDKEFEEPLLVSDASAALPRHTPKLKELAIPLKKLRVATNCINKKPELEEDEYIFCSKCDKLQIGVCSIHSNLQWVKEPTVVSVTEGQTKARATIPNNMDLKSSSIPGAGLGIFAKERFESDVVFGPYWGQKISVADVTPNMDQSYMWDIIEHGRVSHAVDASDENHSNWLRFVNCARNEDEQNLVAFQYRGEIYYRSYKVIEPGMELLVWYGDRYACDLDILDKDNKPADGPIQCQKCFMICWGPISLASHNKFRCQMNSEHDLWRCMHCDRSFKSQSTLHFHKNIHKGLKPFTCKICGKAFSYRASRNRHYSLHIGRESVTCKTCGKVFIDNHSLKNHVRRFHKAQGALGHKKIHAKPDTVSCRTCGKPFRNKMNLLRHESLHKNTAGLRKCQYCGQCFMSGVALSNHIRMHESKDTKNTCSICNASFAYSHNLARHLREKHPQVKLLKCGQCGKVCADKRLLALHVAIRHSGKRGFLQKHSDQKGKVKRSLQQKGITVADSVKCNKCKLTLPRNKLYRHMRIHQKKSMNTLAGHEVHKNNTLNSSGENCGVSATPLKDGYVDNNGGFTCELCLKVFPTSQLMYCHRASHFRKANPSPVIPVGVQSTVPSKGSGREGKRGFLQKHSDQKGKVKRSLQQKGITVADSVKCKKCKLTLPRNKLYRHMRIHQKKSMNTLAGQEVHKNNTLNSSGENCGVSATPPKDGYVDNNGGFTCELCLKVFPTSQLMYCHRASHFRKANPSPVIPVGVQSTVPSKGSQDRTEHESKTFRCEICDKEFKALKLLNCHRGSHFKKWYPCGRCNKSFPSEKMLSLHECRPNSPNAKPPGTSEHAGKFCCKLCNKTFLTRSSLRSHKSHHGRSLALSSTLQKPLQKSFRETVGCQANNACGGKFTSKESLHPNKNRGSHFKKWYPCGRCNKSFPSEKVLSLHECRQNSPSAKPGASGHAGKFCCKLCNKTFLTGSSLLSHKRYHGRSLALSSTLQKPLQKSFQETVVYQANNSCGGQFPSKESLHLKKNGYSVGSKKLLGRRINSTHLCSRFLRKSRHAPGQSSVNPATSSSQSDLSASERTLFRCEVCGKNFHSKTTLNSHKGHHSRTNSLKYFRTNHVACADFKSKTVVDENVPKLYECATCLETFRHRNSLTRHERRSHAGRNAKFICPFCDKTFSCKKNLKVHKRRLHSTGDPFTCLQCNGRFATKRSRNFHPCCVEKKEASMKSKAVVKSNQTVDGRGENPYACDVCLESFQSKRSLSNHKRSHAGSSTPFVCSICHRGLSSKKSLIRHKRSQHSTNVAMHLQCNSKSASKGDRSGQMNHLTSKQGIGNSLQKNSLLANSDAPSISKYSCLPCNKQFLTRGGLYKHDRKKHAMSKSDLAQIHVHTDINVKLNGQHGCKPDAKDNVGHWKCQYCNKKFQTAYGLHRHVKKRHSKRIRLDRQQGCKPRTKSSKGPGKNQHCEKGFQTTVDLLWHVKDRHGKRLRLVHQQGGKLDVQAKTALDVDSIATETSKYTVRAFRCQYCHKGFCTVNGRYKHIMLAHGKELASIPPAPQKNSDTPSTSNYNVVICQVSLAQQERREADQKATTSDKNGIKSKTAKHPIRRKLKPAVIGCKYRCRYCRKEFFSKSYRRKHERCFHEKQVNPSSALPKRKEGKTDNWKPFPNTAFSSEEKLLARKSKNREDIPLTRPSTSSPHVLAASGLNMQLTRKAFSCQYCPRQFLSVSTRYKHALLAHSGERTLPSKVCQLVPKICDESSTTEFGQTVMSSDDGSYHSPVSPAKRMRPSSPLTDQPLSKRLKPQELAPVGDLTTTSLSYEATPSSSKETLIRPKAFQCRFCTKSFSSCSLRYKHFLLVHSRSRALTEQGFGALEMSSVIKPSHTLRRDNSSECVSVLNHVDDSFASQSKILENYNSSPDKCSKVVSVCEDDMRLPDECRICSMVFQGRDDWVSHFKEKHNNAPTLTCRIRSPSRPALRTISVPFQKNNLKTLRNRHITHSSAKVTHAKQLSSVCGRNVVKQGSSTNPSRKETIRHKRFQCDICLVFLSSERSVARHKKTKHCDEKPFQCKGCGLTTKREDHLHQHQRLYCKGRI